MQYATARDGVRIAFAVAGRGPHLVRTPALPFSHVQLDWRTSEFYERLTRLATVVPYDSRGTGLSDRDVEDVSLDARLNDLECVVDHLGLDQFALHAVNFSAPMAITYVVRHPERVSHLVLDDAFASTAQLFETTQNRASRTLAEDWDAFIENVAWLITQQGREETEKYAAFLRAAVTRRWRSPPLRRHGLRRRHRTAAGTSPCRRSCCITSARRPSRCAFGRQLAAAIPGAELVTLAGGSADDSDTILASIARLLGSAAPASAARQRCQACARCSSPTSSATPR